MPKFRKKPVEIEARQFTSRNFDDMQDLVKWIGTKGWHDGYSILIETLEGRHRADFGDWIIKGIKGEFYPCKPDIFEQTYEAID